ncbi:MAG: glutamine synthetase III [Lachnospiraceae bacterium]|nr:glutamine synthetase III [Lachnospiraceae bacterium]
MTNIAEIYGELKFDEREMKKRLPEAVYTEVQESVREGRRLSQEMTRAVAKAMKEWALEKGATHYTHWFQPMTGVTAEKHDSFIEVDRDGGPLLEFSEKALISGESDASSFPSGGLRTTFEARGYTVWDESSFAFIKGHTLCIPTAFCSYNGHALDKKTPLLRSMRSLNRESLRILRLFGNTAVKRVTPSVGAEQEYFLIDKKQFEKRRDLIYTGRTLFGARPPKGQEMDDHYSGAIKKRVEAFMEDINERLWRLGVPAKTEHNEVAPGQHELACIYSAANVATDQNQLVMEIMKKTAEDHDLVCLLHEKPFAGVNGSGKHNNWSISTDTGVNLLAPGETPYENAQFLLFLAAVIQAVDNHQDLLRLSAATAGNDHRLGVSEAPPAVISIFLGDELTGILEAIEKDEPYGGFSKKTMRLGADALPHFPVDSTDRNRTSPFAFTGNKFEFRMVGSSDSIGCANIMLNSAVADTLAQFADELEKAPEFETALHELIRRTIHDHKRILFNGNGYDESWIREAVEVWGLSNHPSTPEALPRAMDENNISMLMRQKVYTREEMQSRVDILLENYDKTVMIEGRTMIEMVRKEIEPAIDHYLFTLADTAEKKLRAGIEISADHEKRIIRKLSALLDRIDEASDALEEYLKKAGEISDVEACGLYLKDHVVPAMQDLRDPCDEAELLTERSVWPFPTYGDLFFGVR